MGIVIGAFNVIVEIFGILVAIVLFFATLVHARNRRLHGLYDVMWKSSSSLTAEEIMDIRASESLNYNEYYYNRSETDGWPQSVIAV
jgi:hypothetical protein